MGYCSCSLESLENTILYFQDVVLLLLKFGAGVSIINGEGRTPLQMADDEEVQKLIKGLLRDNSFHLIILC